MEENLPRQAPEWLKRQILLDLGFDPDNMPTPPPRRTESEADIFHPDTISVKEYCKRMRYNLRRFEKNWGFLDKDYIEEFTDLFVKWAEIGR